MQNLKQLNAEYKKVSRQFYKVQALYDATDDVKYYHQLDEIGAKMSELSGLIEILDEIGAKMSELSGLIETLES